LRIFKNAWFQRFARRENISDAALGGNVIKQRIARPRQGKSGGYRALIVFRRGDRAFFVYGFAKKDRDNIRRDELKVFKRAAKALLALSDEQIEKLITVGGLTEVEL
jgi:hypothetical protein|tara:strand:+ start:146 stop:466 length:321 start_codon:yes stop_codon:yes gene_type:complete